MPPAVRRQLAKRRGTAKQRQLAYDAQAPICTWPKCRCDGEGCADRRRRFEAARDMVRERNPKAFE